MESVLASGVDDVLVGFVPTALPALLAVRPSWRDRWDTPRAWTLRAAAGFAARQWGEAPARRLAQPQLQVPELVLRHRENASPPVTEAL